MDMIVGDVFEDLGDRDIEQASSIHLGTCPHCSCPHLFLMDESGDAFAEVVLDAEILQEMAAVFRSLLADARLAEANGNDREDH